MNPLKQGLKQGIIREEMSDVNGVKVVNPLKQGLKLRKVVSTI